MGRCSRPNSLETVNAEARNHLLAVFPPAPGVGQPDSDPAYPKYTRRVQTVSSPGRRPADRAHASPPRWTAGAATVEHRLLLHPVLLVQH